MDTAMTEAEAEAGPVEGFELPPEGGYRKARQWLASTFLDDDWSFVEACLVTAVDPCEVAQLVNLEHLEALGSVADAQERSRLAMLHDVRIKLEFDEVPRVWRIEAYHGGVVTCVQESCHADAIEDMSDRPFVEREPLDAPSLLPPVTVPAMPQLIGEAERVVELLYPARERFDAFDDECRWVRLPPTWGALADAAAMAAETIDDPAFVNEFQVACATLARELRPHLNGEWEARKDAFKHREKLGADR